MELRLLDDIELDILGLNDHSSLAVLLMALSISFHIFSSFAFVVINTGTNVGSGVEDGKANGGGAMGLNIVSYSQTMIDMRDVNVDWNGRVGLAVSNERRSVSSLRSSMISRFCCV